MMGALKIMTSREVTQILSLNDNVAYKRDFADWAKMLSVGSIQWPWLLKSLYGGRKSEKAALLARLKLSHNALPNLGSWKADVGLLNQLVDMIYAHRPQMVVELGAGASSLIVARSLQLLGRGGRLVSFDQHADFVASTRTWLSDHGQNVDIRHAPIESETGKWADLWYSLTAVPETIDMLIIDGPPWAINPVGRGKAQRLFDRIPTGGVLILDDAARPGERMVARQWRRDWPEFDWTFISGIKGTLIGIRR
jgi:predicted O-methyltransferase YrrM